MAAATVLLLSACADGATTGPDPDAVPGATSSAAPPAPTVSSGAVDAATTPQPDPPVARRISPRLAGLGGIRIDVPTGWTVDWLGVGYLHMGPGHHRYSGGSFAVVSAVMGSGGLEDISGSALAWLRREPGITLTGLGSVVVDGTRHPAFEVQGPGQVCGSPAGSPEAAHHSCMSLRGSVQAYVDLGRERRSLAVMVGARPLGRHASPAAVAERRQRLQELADLVTLER